MKLFLTNPNRLLLKNSNKLILRDIDIDNLIVWILSASIWNDNGIWVDSATWND